MPPVYQGTKTGLILVVQLGSNTLCMSYCNLCKKVRWKAGKKPKWSDFSVLGPALHCHWQITQVEQASLTTVVFLGKNNRFMLNLRSGSLLYFTIQ